MDNAAFEIIRGDDFTIDIQVLDDEGNAIDLTDYSIFFTAKTKLDAPDNEAVLAKEVQNGDTEGMVELSFTSAETTLLKPRSYWWDIQLEKAGIINSTRRQLLRVVGDVTRRDDEDAS